ncbi:MAG: hypothetical protein KC417_12750 [Myxococcales bacterium]|nr:hypothetical protein [Myxococcales bacterium]
MRSRAWQFLVLLGLTACARAPEGEPSVESGATSPVVSNQAASGNAGTDLDPASKEALAQSPVPLLLPGDHELWPHLRVMRGATWGSFVLHDDISTITLQGTRTVHAEQLPDAMPTPSGVRGVTAWTGVGENIPFVSWIEDGVAWMLEVECNSPADARCADPTWATEFVERLESREAP